MISTAPTHEGKAHARAEVTSPRSISEMILCSCSLRVLFSGSYWISASYRYLVSGTLSKERQTRLFHRLYSLPDTSPTKRVHDNSIQGLWGLPFREERRVVVCFTDGSQIRRIGLDVSAELAMPDK